MSSALKESETSIDHFILSSEELAKGQIDRTDIFELMINEEVFGPFLNHELKEYISINNLYSDDVRIKNIDEEEWINSSLHPYFQRRRPSLVSSKTMADTNEKYFILNDGKKDGPFTKEQVNTMLDSHQILATHFVSVDNGQSWGKLFEIEGFDRRVKTHDTLPFRPNSNIFTNSIYDADKAISLAQAKSAETDAIVGLAYIGHLNEGKKKLIIDNVQAKNLNSQEDDSEEENQSKISSSILNIFFGVCIVAGSYFIYDQLSGDIPLPTKPTEEVNLEAFQKKPAAKVKNKLGNINDRKPAAKSRTVEVSKNKRMVTRSAESIKKAEFLKKDMTEGEVVDVPPEAIFDDVNEAVELDPIRSRISSETLNGEQAFSDEDMNSFRGNLGPVDSNGNAQDEINDAQSESIESFE